AYDNLFEFDGEFSSEIDSDNIRNLSVSFLAKGPKVFYGGCGANIAFNLSLLGVDTDLYGVLGKDSSDYIDHLNSCNITTSHIAIDENSSSSAAFILSDQKNNQISFFSVGAMENSKLCMEID